MPLDDRNAVHEVDKRLHSQMMGTAIEQNLQRMKEWPTASSMVDSGHFEDGRLDNRQQSPVPTKSSAPSLHESHEVYDRQSLIQLVTSVIIFYCALTYHLPEPLPASCAKMIPSFVLHRPLPRH